LALKVFNQNQGNRAAADLIGGEPLSVQQRCHCLVALALQGMTTRDVNEEGGPSFPWQLG